MKAVILGCCLVGSLFAQEPISLLNGKDLTGWSVDVPAHDAKKPEKPTFFVEDGMLVTSGKPLGHIYTEASFSDYSLTIEYRFPENAGNCGVMVHSTEKRFHNKMFPRSIEVQMFSGNAGDFITIGEDITGTNGASNPELVGKSKTSRKENLTNKSEKPIGEWNTMVIHCQGDVIVVTVNGDLVNVGTKSSVTKGMIGLQSEGSRVEFRKIELTKLKP